MKKHLKSARKACEKLSDTYYYPSDLFGVGIIFDAVSASLARLFDLKKSGKDSSPLSEVLQKLSDSKKGLIDDVQKLASDVDALLELADGIGYGEDVLDSDIEHADELRERIHDGLLKILAKVDEKNN